MLAKRIIPILLMREETLVKGRQFNSWRSVGHIQQAARIHAMRGVDEMVILDIGATPEGRRPDFELVRKLTEGNFAPITVGGGVKSIEDIQDLLEAGADKVAICTASFPTFENIIPMASARFGSQAIVAVVDYKYATWTIPPQEIAYVEAGVLPTSYTPVELASYYELCGAGEILLTSMDSEGMMNGCDLELIKAVSEAVEIPVIAHGGCGTPHHALEAIQSGASAVGIGAMFQFTDETPRSVALYLHKHGVEVRL